MNENLSAEEKIDLFLKDEEEDEGPDVEEIWSEIVLTLMKVEGLWEEFSKEVQKLESLDDLPIRTQEILSRVSIYSSFSNALDAMITYWTSQGGLEVFLPEQKSKEKEND